MSANDKNISNNRRKLFKALSTAPVVMTLNPGAALAGGSAYQCVKKCREKPPHDWIPEEHAGSGKCDTRGDCEVNEFRFKKRHYWVKDHGQRVKNTAVNCPDVVVQLDDGFYGLDGQKYYNLRVNGESNGRPTLEVLDSDNEVCWKIPQGKRGLFSKVGHSYDNDKRYTEHGEFPKKKISRWDKPGEPQGMTGTCLNSFADASGSGLNNG